MASRRQPRPLWHFIGLSYLSPLCTYKKIISSWVNSVPRFRLAVLTGRKERTKKIKVDRCRSASSKTGNQIKIVFLKRGCVKEMKETKKSTSEGENEISVSWTKASTIYARIFDRLSIDAFCTSRQNIIAGIVTEDLQGGGSTFEKIENSLPIESEDVKSYASIALFGQCNSVAFER